MNETIQAINHAAAQSDRWLFLAMLVVVLFAAVFAIRYFIGQIQQIQTKADEQVTHARKESKEAFDSFNKYLQEANKQLVDAIIHHSEALERNSVAFEANSKMLEKILR